MIQRLVKFTIRNGKEADFLKLCENSKLDFLEHTNGGCMEYKLWQDTRVSSIFFSLTIWKNQEAIDFYHHSTHCSNFWKNVVDVSALSPEVFVLKNV